MELLYDASIPLISSTQEYFYDYNKLMKLISTVFDPKYAFLIYSPIIFAIDHKIGRKLMLTTVLAEWINQILKWLLHGERPYWYVHSSGKFNPELTPIHQFSVTCELGPGDPSGHAMVTAAVWYIIISSFFDLDKHNSEHPNRSPLFDVLRTRRHHITGWFLYVVLIVIVSLSRVCLGCHFPHQCLAGALIGVILARAVSSWDFLQFKKRHFLFSSIIMFVTAFALFASLQWLGFDPSWTIKNAVKYCAKREYIHMDTAPFFSIMRYCGFCLGCGLGLSSPLFKYLHHKSSSSQMSLLTTRRLASTMLTALISLLAARMVDNLGQFVSHNNIILFYSSAMLAYLVFSFSIVAIIPYLVDRHIFKYKKANM